MLLIAAATIASALPQDASVAPVRPVVQARATVRIVAGARIQWDGRATGGEIPAARTTVIKTADGPQTAKLVEFE